MVSLEGMKSYYLLGNLLLEKLKKNRGVYNFTTPEKTKGRTTTNKGGGLKYQLNFLFAADFFS